MNLTIISANLLATPLTLIPTLVILTMIGNVGVIVLWTLYIVIFPPQSSRNVNLKPWFDSEVRHLLNQKETARRRPKRNPNTNIWETFRNLRRACKSLLSRKRKEFFEILPRANPKKFWPLFQSMFEYVECAKQNDLET